MRPFSPLDINIASRPFRQERAQNALLALIGAGLVCSLLVLGSLILHARAQAADLRRVISQQQAQLGVLRQSSTTYTNVLGKPGNADVFAQSVLLNEVISRRSVSWTRVFTDIGTVLPNNMRLLSLRLPQVGGEDKSGKNRVQLDMWVGADQPAAIVGFLDRLVTSPLFGDASVMSQQPPTQNDPLYKYRLTVAYAQQL